MIGTIRKHSQFLWVFIIAGTIIAFVVFFMPGQDPFDYSSVDYGSRYGRKLKLEDRRAAQRDANLLFFMQVGRLPDSSSRVAELVEERLMMNSLALEQGITVSDETMKAWMRRIFRDPQTGKASAKVYDAFIQRLKQETRYTELDVEDWIRNTAAADHLRRMYTLSGSLISTRAADLFIRHENEQAEAEFVYVPMTNYLSQVKYTTNDINSYFTNNTASFRIPERVVVNYVHFDFSATNYMSKAEKTLSVDTNLQSRIDARYLERGTNSFRNAKGDVLSKEEAAKKIREEFVEDEAAKIGEEDSRMFANEVFKIAEVKTENLFTVAKQMGYEVKESEPFTELDGPEDFDAPGAFARSAFQLSSDEPLTSPIKGVDGVWVIAYNRRVASEIPSVTNVWEDVVEEYRDSKANELLRESGRKLADTIEKGLSSGQLLRDILKPEKLRAIPIPPFSRTTRSIPQVETFGVTTDEFVTAAFDLEQGGASSFRSARNGGYIVHLKKRVPIAEDKVAKGLENYVKELRESRMGIVNQAWVQDEFVVSGVMAERQAAMQERQQAEAEAQAEAAGDQAN